MGAGTAERAIDRLIMSVPEVAEILDCGDREVFRKVSQHYFPDSVVLHLGKRVLFRRHAFMAWLGAHDG